MRPEPIYKRPEVGDFDQFYNEFNARMNSLTESKKKALFQKACQTDIYFLLRYGLGYDFMNLRYVHQQCKFVDDLEEARGSLDNCVFMWFREGFKSTILTIGKAIQSILRNPETSILILSNTAPGAKVFLNSIKLECENNQNLLKYFDHIFWENTNKSPQWSLDKGLMVKRKTNRKEATVMASGLVDSQPVKLHCNELIYDDVVTPDSVHTEMMNEKTTEAMYTSFCLGSNVLGQEGQKRFIGTRYADNDTWGKMIDAQPCPYFVNVVPWHIGDGETPRVHTKAKIAELQATMSKYAFNCQYELDPTPSSERVFYTDISYYKEDNIDKNWNFVMLVDPSGENKKKRGHSNDNTAIAVIGRDWKGREYLVDGYYGPITLTGEDGQGGRIAKIFNLVRKYGITDVWYEKVGVDSAIGSIKDAQLANDIYFNIHPFHPIKYGSKNDRIENALMPRLQTQKMLFPQRLIRKQEGGNEVDLVQILKDEMERFPHGKHDDMLDCLAQITAVPPYGEEFRGTFDNNLTREAGEFRHEHVSDMELRRREAEHSETFESVEYL
jgi:hypothetical protein